MRPNELGIVPCSSSGAHFPHPSVNDNLQMGAYLQSKCKSKTEFHHNLEFIFKFFPTLKEQKKQKGGTLSGRRWQTVADARNCPSLNEQA